MNFFGNAINSLRRGTGRSERLWEFKKGHAIEGGRDDIVGFKKGYRGGSENLSNFQKICGGFPRGYKLFRKSYKQSQKGYR